MRKEQARIFHASQLFPAFQPSCDKAPLLGALPREPQTQCDADFVGADIWAKRVDPPLALVTKSVKEGKDPKDGY